MGDLSTSRFTLRDIGEPCGLRVTDRNTANAVLLDPQAATELLTFADRLAGAALSPPTLDRSLNWLIESYL